MKENFWEELAKKVPYIKLEISVDKTKTIGNFKLENGSILDMIYDLDEGLIAYLNNEPVDKLTFGKHIPVSVDLLANSLIELKEDLLNKPNNRIVPAYANDMDSYEKSGLDKQVKQAAIDAENPSIINNSDKKLSRQDLYKGIENVFGKRKQRYVEKVQENTNRLQVDFKNEPKIAYFDAFKFNTLYSIMKSKGGIDTETKYLKNKFIKKVKEYVPLINLDSEGEFEVAHFDARQFNDAYRQIMKQPEMTDKKPHTDLN